MESNARVNYTRGRPDAIEVGCVTECYRTKVLSLQEHPNERRFHLLLSKMSIGTWTSSTSNAKWLYDSITGVNHTVLHHIQLQSITVPLRLFSSSKQVHPPPLACSLTHTHTHKHRQSLGKQIMAVLSPPRTQLLFAIPDPNTSLAVWINSIIHPSVASSLPSVP